MSDQVTYRRVALHHHDMHRLMEDVNAEVVGSERIVSAQWSDYEAGPEDWRTIEHEVVLLIESPR